VVNVLLGRDQKNFPLPIESESIKSSDIKLTNTSFTAGKTFRSKKALTDSHFHAEFFYILHIEDRFLSESAKTVFTC